MNFNLSVIVLYAVAMVLIGLGFSRKIRTSADFFVAGRKMPAGLLFATLLAANIGSGSTVGATGLGYAEGFSAWWWVGSAGIGQILLAFTVGPKLWRLAAEHGFLTVGDFLERRYSRAVRAWTASLVWIGSLFILAGQLLGIAWILNVVTGTSKLTGCLLGGLCVVLYFTAGGLLSTAWVNVLQLTVKLSGFALAVPLVLMAAGGWESILAAAAQRTDAAHYTRFTGSGFSTVLTYLTLLVPPFIVSPGLLQKVYGARDEKAARIGTALNGMAMLMFSFLPMILGVAAAKAFPGLPNRELALPTLMIEMLPAWAGALALAAIFSAELSAADAVLFMLSTSASKDLYLRFFRSDAGERKTIAVGRLSAIVAGLLGVSLAIFLPTIITALSVFYGLLTVAMCIPILSGLYSARPGAGTALSAIFIAVPLTVALHLGSGGKGVLGLSPVSWGLACSLLVFAVGRARRTR